MPDPTNYIGQCIAYQIDPGQSAAAHPGAVAPMPGQTTMANVTIGPDPRNLGGGTPWMFAFLKYCAGEVTTCALAGGVLTGPMSGCYLFRYQVGGAIRLPMSAPITRPILRARSVPRLSGTG